MLKYLCRVTSSGELAGLISPVDEFDSRTRYHMIKYNYWSSDQAQSGERCYPVSPDPPSVYQTVHDWLGAKQPVGDPGGSRRLFLIMI